jgi:gamma-butyrobetaine dioxygenase
VTFARAFLPNITRISQDDVTNTKEGCARLTRALIEDGIAIVTGMENTTESLPRLTQAVGPISPSAAALSLGGGGLRGLRQTV